MWAIKNHSSPLMCAVQTAEIIALGVRPVIDQRLKKAQMET